MERFPQKILEHLIGFFARAAKGLLITVALLTIAFAYYAATHLRFNTSTLNMLDPSLRFRVLEREFDRSFPQLNDLTITVIDGDTAQQAEDVAQRLASVLRTEMGRRLKWIYRPGSGPFFEHNGLLYLGKKDLAALSDQLIEAAPFLGRLSQDTSVRGLFSVLNQALAQKELSQQNRAILNKVFDAMDRTMRTILHNRPQPMSWQQLLLAKSGPLKQGRRSLVLIKPLLKGTGLASGQAVLDAVRAHAEQIMRTADGARIRLTGSVAMDAEELQSVSANAGLATGLSFALVWVVLLIGLRSAALVVCVLITLVIGLTWTFAFALGAIGYLNLISATFAVLFIGMGVDFGIQFAMRFREECGHQAGRIPALVATTVGVGGTLTLAATAAAISFLSFVPTHYTGVAELGIISAAGMLIALAANMTVLPAMLNVTPGRIVALNKGSDGSQALGFSLTRHRRAIIWIALVISIAAAAIAPRARFDFNPVNMRDPNAESVATFKDLVKNSDATPYTIDILARDLKAAQKLAKRVEKLPEVDKAITLASYIPEQQREKLAIINDLNLVLGFSMLPSSRGPAPNAAEAEEAINTFIENSREWISTARNTKLSTSLARLVHDLKLLKQARGWPERVLPAFNKNLIGDLPDVLTRLRSLLKARPVSLAEIPKDVRQQYITADGRARVQVFPSESMNNTSAMRQFVAAVQAIAPNATGAPVSLVEAGKVVVGACVQAALTALVCASLLMLVVLRSLLDMLLMLLPLLFAMLLTTAGSVVLGVHFNFANVIALPLLLGIAVAFGVYLMMRKRAGMDIDHLFASSTPRAVFFSALTTIAAFGTLAISRHRGMASMGLLLTIALSLALIGTLIILPALLSVVDDWRARRGMSAN
ncbi:MAG TPA: MMPL family transporter [Gammaproteobacteria bacterium]|nr:MMPL family transporter [Gammaproteobacteria bacterium]